MLNIEELRKKLEFRIKKEKREFATKSLHILERPLKAGTTLVIGPNKYQVPRDAFLVVIDEAPGAFWTHPVRYELHGAEKGEVTVIPEQYPLEEPDFKAELVALHIPDLPHLKKEEGEDFFELAQIKLGRLEKAFVTASFDLSRPCVSNRHALFVAGMDNMPHFHTDFVFMRDILIERYGYDPANIVIVMGDGTGYADLPVDYPGTVAGLDTALDTYAAGGTRELGANDSLFLYTFNHGGLDGVDAYLCMAPAWDNYYDHQLLAKLNNIQCGDLIVAMNQCHSGGFIPEVLSTTGPNRVAIMTACRHDQSAYPTSVGSHGYLSVALYTALNWAFPAGIPATFPGYVAGTITTQDANNDGMVSAEDAWHYVHDMMHANHWATINGIETPQWGESPAGAGTSLFWGLPHIVVEDGTPWWESPDVYLNDPAVTPSDATSGPPNPPNPNYWGDNYHPDTPNRIVARVHNTGCAPCRNTTVEFRVMSFGAGGGTTLVGTAPIEDVNPGHHGFAWVDYNFPSALIHICAMVRAYCVADPALPFGTPITSDDNQAQRNIDPAYSAPGSGNPKPVEKVIERTFKVRNELGKEGVFGVSLAKTSGRTEYIRTEILKLKPLSELPLKAELMKRLPLKGEPQQGLALKAEREQEVAMRFVISPEARIGDKFRFPVEIRRLDPNAAVVGGVTFTIEIAEGRLEGRVVSDRGLPITKGKVTIENIKQAGKLYSTEIVGRGTFSFKNIDPGPYRIWAECEEGKAKDSLFVEPNAITRKTLVLTHLPRATGVALKDERGKLLSVTQVAVTDPKAKLSYLAYTNPKGVFNIPGLSPGEYEITMPEKKGTPPKKVKLDFLTPKPKEVK